MVMGATWAKAWSEKSGLLDDEAGLLESGYGAATVTKTETQLGRRCHSTKDQPFAERWMSGLPDGVPLSGITIPGTHDSAAFTYSLPFITTQKMNILQQLNAGIRYFDLRCAVREDVVEMVHGVQYLGLRLEDIVETMCNWLDDHPSEGIIAQIKKDRRSVNSHAYFANAVVNVLLRKSSHWRTANTTPTVGEIRGRIQLFRRFEGPSLDSYGVDVSEWQDNPRHPFTIYTSHYTRITVQDHYSWSGPKTLPALIAEKGGDVSGLLNRAADDLDVHHWYINFASAYEFNIYFQISPREIAVGGYWGFTWVEGMNIRLRTFLSDRQQHRKRFGIVAMDFPEAVVVDLVMAVIRSNFEHEGGGVWDMICFWIPMILLLMFIAVAAMII